MMYVCVSAFFTQLATPPCSGLYYPQLALGHGRGRLRGLGHQADAEQRCRPLQAHTHRQDDEQACVHGERRLNVCTFFYFFTLVYVCMCG